MHIPSGNQETQQYFPVVNPLETWAIDDWGSFFWLQRQAKDQEALTPFSAPAARPVPGGLLLPWWNRWNSEFGSQFQTSVAVLHPFSEEASLQRAIEFRDSGYWSSCNFGLWNEFTHNQMYLWSRFLHSSDSIFAYLCPSNSLIRWFAGHVELPGLVT